MLSGRSGEAIIYQKYPSVLDWLRYWIQIVASACCNLNHAFIFEYPGVINPNKLVLLQKTKFDISLYALLTNSYLCIQCDFLAFFWQCFAICNVLRCLQFHSLCRIMFELFSIQSEFMEIWQKCNYCLKYEGGEDEVKYVWENLSAHFRSAKKYELQ